eukprot:365666-Chlamydomonas_euryale.AAC.11
MGRLGPGGACDGPRRLQQGCYTARVEVRGSEAKRVEARGRATGVCIARSSGWKRGAGRQGCASHAAAGGSEGPGDRGVHRTAAAAAGGSEGPGGRGMHRTAAVSVAQEGWLIDAAPLRSTSRQGGMLMTCVWPTAGRPHATHSLRLPAPAHAAHGRPAALTSTRTRPIGPYLNPPHRLALHLFMQRMEGLPHWQVDIQDRDTPALRDELKRSMRV